MYQLFSFLFSILEQYYCRETVSDVFCLGLILLQIKESSNFYGNFSVLDNCICDFSNAVDLDSRQKETEIPIADAG